MGIRGIQPSPPPKKRDRDGDGRGIVPPLALLTPAPSRPFGPAPRLAVTRVHQPGFAIRAPHYLEPRKLNSRRFGLSPPSVDSEAPPVVVESSCAASASTDFVSLLRGACMISGTPLFRDSIIVAYSFGNCQYT